MQRIYLLIVGVLLGLGIQNVSAQRVVDIAASTDPVNPTDIFPEIMGDTTATGARIDSNTVYRLENGESYITTGRIVNEPGWDLHIEAVDLNDTENKPIIGRIPNASGTFPDIMRPNGNVTLKNLWIVSGEKGALEQHDWGKIRISGANTRVIVSDCIIEKDRGGILQIRADGVKCYVSNSIFRNGGNRRILQGNGRGFDSRNFAMDTLIMRNTVVHNMQDRFFRSQGGVTPHNYIEIDNCTGFNIAGRHGFIQLGKVITAKITNNLFINPIMLGTSPIYTDEQTQPDNGTHKVITLDTVYSNTQLIISNNNIHWTQDVLDYYATNDSVDQVAILSDLVKDVLGADTTDAYFEEVIALDSVPGTILEYVEDLYADPAATDMYDFIVEDITLAGTDFDSGNLFALEEFSTCYDATSTSATAATNGGAVGALSGCDDLLALNIDELNLNLGFRLAPNPVSQQVSFFFEQAAPGQVDLQIYSLTGKLVAMPFSGFLGSGENEIQWSVSTDLSAGLYLAKVQTKEGFQTLKFYKN
ncbi:MAG: T9SS type A sorting domain-containing protein [Bacteroidota bacterium]